MNIKKHPFEMKVVNYQHFGHVRIIHVKCCKNLNFKTLSCENMFVCCVQHNMIFAVDPTQQLDFEFNLENIHDLRSTLKFELDALSTIYLLSFLHYFRLVVVSLLYATNLVYYLYIISYIFL